jgi:hypothetical protein
LFIDDFGGTDELVEIMGGSTLSSTVFDDMSISEALAQIAAGLPDEIIPEVDEEESETLSDITGAHLGGDVFADPTMSGALSELVLGLPDEEPLAPVEDGVEAVIDDSVSGAGLSANVFDGSTINPALNELTAGLPDEPAPMSADGELQGPEAVIDDSVSGAGLSVNVFDGSTINPALNELSAGLPDEPAPVISEDSSMEAVIDDTVSGSELGPAVFDAKTINPALNELAADLPDEPIVESAVDVDGDQVVIDDTVSGSELGDKVFNDKELGHRFSEIVSSTHADLSKDTLEQQRVIEEFPDEEPVAQPVSSTDDYVARIFETLYAQKRKEEGELDEVIDGTAPVPGVAPAAGIAPVPGVAPVPAVQPEPGTQLPPVVQPVIYQPVAYQPGMPVPAQVPVEGQPVTPTASAPMDSASVERMVSDAVAKAVGESVTKAVESAVDKAIASTPPIVMEQHHIVPANINVEQRFGLAPIDLAKFHELGAAAAASATQSDAFDIPTAAPVTPGGPIERPSVSLPTETYEMDYNDYAALSGTVFQPTDFTPLIGETLGLDGGNSIASVTPAGIDELGISASYSLGPQEPGEEFIPDLTSFDPNRYMAASAGSDLRTPRRPERPSLLEEAGEPNEADLVPIDLEVPSLPTASLSSQNGNITLDPSSPRSVLDMLRELSALRNQQQ